ncbi:MAG: 3'(2'),5'-bisphosphate nucleotidase CysQ [Flavobacteriaceae bacterium]|jgi:3'(2'), 5'-bisphosphate nucleotidase|nr:3'(2'),5'-bisphosphate nucleotidase CysQ [Flavobacteriaceae bacterium]
MKDLLNAALKGAIQASKEVYKKYNEGFSVRYKSDKSPVTTSDLIANEILIKHLTPTELPILSEESDKYTPDILSSWQKYWCIDPIDGTQEYVDKTDEYCISVGLLTPETSLLGVLAAPSLGLFYFAADGIGSYKWSGSYEELWSLSEKENLCDELLKNSVKLALKTDLQHYTLLASRSFYSQEDEKYYQKLKSEHPDLQRIQMGSVIKIGQVAEGRANEYTRFSQVNFWDIAGGHAVAKYAGLQISNPLTEKDWDYKDISSLKISGYIIKNV